MKTTVFFLLSMLCISLSAQDNERQTILKKANTIIITDNLSALDFYTKISDLLFENGYGILNANKDNGTITTTEKSFKNGVIKLNFLIKDQKVLLRGDYKDDISIDFGGVSQGPSWSVIAFYGQKNSVARNAWDEMNKIAQQIPGKKEYLIR